MNLLRNEGVEGRQFSQQPVTQQTYQLTNGTTNTVLQHSANSAGHVGGGGGGFNCRRCGKAEYRNGEFATIKLGDIFTHIDQFPSATSSETLCAACACVNDGIGRSQGPQGGGVNRNYSNGVINTNNNDIPLSSSSGLKPLGLTNATSTIVSMMDYHANNAHHGQLTSIRSPPVMDTGVLVGGSSGSATVLHRSSDAYGSPGLVGSRDENIGRGYRDNNTEEAIHQMTASGDNLNILNHGYVTVLSSNGALETKVAIPVISQTSQNHNPELSNPGGNRPPPYKILGGIGGRVPSVPGSPIGSTADVTMKKPDFQQQVNKSGPGDTKKTGKAKTSSPGGKEDPPRVPCSLCKKTFKNQTMASIHLKRVHEKVNRFVCEICGVGFSYRGSLDSHLASHNPPEITHDCPTCGQKFKEKSNLNKHIRYHTENPKKFLCEHCPSGFSKRVNLRYHIKRKHPEVAMNNNNIPMPVLAPGFFPPPGGDKSSNFNSGEPTVTLSSSSTLTPLVTSNSAAIGGGCKPNGKDKTQGNFKCEQCGRGFLFKNNLKAHLRTHTRDKKYTCDLCQKSFIYKESLKNHMLLHSNELPYLCDICGKKFRDRSNRRKHVKNVHKYMFVNGDINNPIPANTVGGPGNMEPASQHSGQPIAVPSTAEPKKKKGGKRGTAQGESLVPKPRNIIKSSPSSRAKKTKATTSSNPSVSIANNAKSVIVSTSSPSLETGSDRKIIMSPNPKNSRSPGSSMEYISHPHHALPVTLHIPLAGPSGQFSQSSSGSRNVIVKASSTLSSNHSMSPEMYLPVVGDDRGVPMQQNVIVYPKSKGMTGHHENPHEHQHHLHQYSSVAVANSVISQNMHQSHSHHTQQYYSSKDQQEDSSRDRCYESRNYQGHGPPHSQSSEDGLQQSQNSSSGFEYILSTSPPVSNPPSNEDIKMFGTPPPVTIGEIPGVEGSQYSNLYSNDASTAIPYHHPHPPHYWIPNLGPNLPHPGNASSPYLAESRSDTPSGGVLQPSHFASRHPITSASNVINAPSYGQPHASESVDPSGNVSNFLYKDLSQFDFSYL